MMVSWAPGSQSVVRVVGGCETDCTRAVRKVVEGAVES